MSEQQHDESANTEGEGSELSAEAESAIDAILDGEDLSLQPEDRNDVPEATGAAESEESEEEAASEQSDDEASEDNGAEAAAEKGDADKEEQTNKPIPRAEYLAAVGRKDQQLRQAKAELKEMGQRLEQAGQTPSDSVAREAIRSNPYAALRDAGVDVSGFLKGIVEGKYEADSSAAPASQDAPKSAMEQRLATLEAQNDQLQAEKAQHAQGQEYEAQQATVKGYLDKSGEYPLVSELGLEGNVLTAVLDRLGEDQVSGREAHELIDLCATEIEKAQAGLLERANKAERVRSKYLSDQTEDLPARSASKGKKRGSPQISNLASQRRSKPAEQDFSMLSEADLIEQAALDAQAAMSG